MIHNSRRATLLALLAIALIAIAVRYPLVEHERHNDTYIMELLSGSIQDNGYAKWTFSPLSYFGYYPGSYPSGMPFLMAELSEMTGLNSDVVILLTGMFVGVFFAFVVFCLARQFISRPQYILLAALLASVGPRFVDTSYWNGSARGLFAALAIYTIFISFRAGSTSQRAMYGLIMITVVGCFSLHHMAVLFVLFGMAYVLSTTIAYLAARIGSGRSSRNAGKMSAGATLIVLSAAVILVSVFEFGYFEKELSSTFSKSSLFSIGNPSLAIVVNLAVSYTNQMGFILPLSILGAPIVLLARRASKEVLFLMALPILFIPLLPSSLYITLLLTPFMAILGASWISILRENRRMLSSLLVVALVLASVALPFWSCNRWNKEEDTSGDMVVSNDQVFNDANYLRLYQGEVDATSNDYILSQRLSGISGTLFLRSGVVSAVTGDLTSESLKNNVTWMKERFPNNLYLWFASDSERDLDTHIIMFILSGIVYHNGSHDLLDSGARYFDVHSRLLVAIDNEWPTTFVWVWGVVNADLPNQLRNASWGERLSLTVVVYHPLPSYLIYESQRISLYALEVPDSPGQ